MRRKDREAPFYSESLRIIGPSERLNEMVQSNPVDRVFLFSIDLEDIRRLLPDGDRYAERVPSNTSRILEFLSNQGAHCTFFTVGDIARRYPALIREIISEGHEIACHSNDHLPLDRHTPESFREDLKACRESYAAAGAEQVIGFRAPIGSLIESTRWAFDVLREEGFRYSSSVCAAKNPLYGWPDFGPDRPCQIDGLWELPMSLTHWPGLNVPFAGGIYLRVIPFFMIQALFKRRVAQGEPVVGYLHPYDIDFEQERFMHPEINDSRFYNSLLYWNRRGVFNRLGRLLEGGTQIIRYREYWERLEATTDA